MLKLSSVKVLEKKKNSLLIKHKNKLCKKVILHNFPSQVNLSCCKDVAIFLLENKTKPLIKMCFFFLPRCETFQTNAHFGYKANDCSQVCCNYTTPDSSSVCINLSGGALLRSLSSNIHLSVLVETLPFASLLPLPPLPGASL